MVTGIVLLVTLNLNVLVGLGLKSLRFNVFLSKVNKMILCFVIYLHTYLFSSSSNLVLDTVQACWPAYSNGRQDCTKVINQLVLGNKTHLLSQSNSTSNDILCSPTL